MYFIEEIHYFKKSVYVHKASDERFLTAGDDAIATDNENKIHWAIKCNARIRAICGQLNKSYKPGKVTKVTKDGKKIDKVEIDDSEADNDSDIEEVKAGYHADVICDEKVVGKLSHSVASWIKKYNVKWTHTAHIKVPSHYKSKNDINVSDDTTGNTNDNNDIAAGSGKDSTNKRNITHYFAKDKNDNKNTSQEIQPMLLAAEDGDDDNTNKLC